MLSFDPIAEARRQWHAHGWGSAADGMAAVTSIIRVEQIYLARADRALAPLGLTFARFELLTLLVFTRAGSLPLGKLGARLQVHQTSVTNAVDRLEEQGLVQRVPHPTDGRTVLATITPKGRRLAKQASDALNRTVFADTGLSLAELQQVFELLAKVRRVSGDFVPI